MYRPLAKDGVVRKLIAAAGAASSIHNTQPWRFWVTDDVVEVHGDPDRMLWVADPRGRALHLSCGAALFNLRLAIRMLGAKPLVWPLPDPEGKPTLLASVRIEEARPATWEEREMFEAVHQRHTSRAPFSSRPVPETVQIQLEREARLEFADLRVLNLHDAALALDLAAAADKALAIDFDHRAELDHWIATEGDDGIPSSALGHRPTSQPAPVRDFGYASPTTVRPSGRYEQQPRLRY
jgi:nitroreductase